MSTSLPQTNAALLNEAQRNVLRITLRLADEGLRTVMRLLHDGAFEDGMHGMADDLSPDQQETIAHEVRRGREIIRRIQAQFALKPEVHRKSHLVGGEVLPLWEMALEAQTRYLKGYGPVAPGLADVLDQPVARLADVVARIHAVARPCGVPARGEVGRGSEGSTGSGS